MAGATLLERDVELRRLQSWLDDAADGRGRAVFVGGDAGVGKSALVTTLVDGAGDVRRAVGRCDALATPRALGPFLDVAVALGLDEPAGGRDGLLAALLGAVRAGPPALVVVEDAHWADEATVELIALLGRRVADLPMLLVVTYRDDEAPAGHPLRQVIGDLVTATATSWVGLAPLSVGAVTTLAEPYDVDGPELHRRTGGNPFFVTEALASPDAVVPPTVRLAVLARAARLDPGARSVVEAVSVVPGRAERWLVAALCEPVPGAVDAATTAGVLVAADGTLTFRHELARLSVEAELGEDRRVELHRRALAVLRGRAGVDPARLAHHAGAAGDEDVLAEASVAACRTAIARSAHHEAIRHGERALSLDTLLDPATIADLQAALAPAYVAVARGEEAVELASRAVEHHHRTGDECREAAALIPLSTALSSIGRTEESTATAMRAVTVLERHPPDVELARAYLRVGAAHMLARERDLAVCWGDRSIALAAELDEQPVLGRALVQRGIADVMDGRHDEGMAFIEQGIALGRRLDLPDVIALGLLQIGSGCGEMRRYDVALPALVEGAAFTTARHLEEFHGYVIAWLGRCHFDLGEWDEAERRARDVLASRGTSMIARFVALNTLGWLRARRGDGDVWPALDEALTIARTIGHLQRLWPVAVARAEAGWLAGSIEPHVEVLEDVLALAERCRHRIAAGEIALWLARAGRLSSAPAGAFEPFARWLAGDHLGAATDFRRLGCPYEAAAALADAGDDGSLRQAFTTFDRLGAAPMAEATAARLRAHGVRPPRRRERPEHADGLSGREVEVLRLVAAGFTNPQIAAALYISRKTAEHHVSNILLKLGVTSRTEAAAEALRRGLLDA